MNANDYLIIAIATLGLVVLTGFFYTKKPGFGKYTTSLVLLILVFLVTALFFAAGKIEINLFTNVLFAIAGFAGGLITEKSNRSEQ